MLLLLHVQMLCIDMLLVMISTTVCTPLPGNQILISKYLARRRMVVSGGGAMDPDGNRLQNSCSPRHWGHSMHL